MDEEISKLLNILPSEYSSYFFSKETALDNLLEIVLDVGRVPFARYISNEVQLSETPVTKDILKDISGKVSSFTKENRSGIEATLHRISCIRNRNDQIIGLTCRVGRAISGNLGKIETYAKQGKNILLVGPPACGKSTILRELSRVLSDKYNLRVMIVDTSEEIGGSGDVAHPAIGKARRMFVKNPSLQHLVMIEAVENHMPEVIIVDELSTKADAEAARTIAERGVQLLATAHGIDLNSIVANPDINTILGSPTPVTLGDDEAKKRGTQKTVLERSHQSSFEVIVEMDNFKPRTIYENAEEAVDKLLRAISGSSTDNDELNQNLDGIFKLNKSRQYQRKKK